MMGYEMNEIRRRLPVIVAALISITLVGVSRGEAAVIGFQSDQNQTLGGDEVWLNCRQGAHDYSAIYNSGRIRHPKRSSGSYEDVYQKFLSFLRDSGNRPSTTFAGGCREATRTNYDYSWTADSGSVYHEQTILGFDPLGLQTPPGPLETIRVNYGSPSPNGYIRAWIDLEYKFIACQGELHFAYSLKSDSTAYEGGYSFEGEEYPIEGAAPPQSTVTLSTGFIIAYKEVGSRMTDTFAAPALGFGCFSGQTHKVGLLRELITGPVTPASTKALIESVFPTQMAYALVGREITSPHPLINAAFESRLRAMSPSERAGFARSGSAGARAVLDREAEQSARREADRQRREAAEAREREHAAARAAEAAATANLNREILERDQAIVAANEAAEREYQRKLAETQAENARITREAAQRDAAYRAEVARINAETARQAAAYAAAQAAYRACLAGDRSQCAAPPRQ